MRRNLMSILISKKEEFVFGVPEQFVTFTHPTKEFKIEFSNIIEDTYQLYYSIDDGDNWARAVKETTTPLTSKIDFFGYLPKNTLLIDYDEYDPSHPPVFRYFLDNDDEEIKGEISVSGNLRALITDIKHQLPKTIAPNTFTGLFLTQSALKYADELILDANNYGYQSCNYFFANCKFLLTAPTITGSHFGEISFWYSFHNCNLLTDASNITIPQNAFIQKQSFREMFSFCTSLEHPPTLAATTLAEACYENMFSGCESLVIAPELPAPTLTNRCYQSMFSGCYSLIEIKLGYIETNTDYTDSWVSNISTAGTLYKAGTQYSSSGRDTYPNTWTQVPWNPNE